MIDVTIFGPLAYRAFTLERECQENQGHTHNHDHVTFVRAGSLRVFSRTDPDGPEEGSRVYRAGDFFLVRKDVYHRIKAMEPDTRYACVFAHRDADGLITREYEGYHAAYV
jgi:quercetin dioxygenase-like cupin family protein